MEAAKSIVENGKTTENENVGFEDDVDSEDDEENLKRRISSHPLYGLLIETNFNCLKEAYYITLKKLKAAMEEPLQESTSFIEEMYIQLRELSEATHPNNPKPNSPTH
ncbi:hypothetical protein LWI29_020720 [Acer saccharum]|uniref:Uncharacterized protein n=1 Tax=Acer saccharum TaxID=4024 RepID=A0AA39RHC0_ACESA|nr:hypothetical protein LWI29_020720 [Acer saccharum]